MSWKIEKTELTAVRVRLGKRSPYQFDRRDDVTQDLPDLSVKKVVIFDFDGVLAESVEVKTEAFAELYLSYGKEVVERVVDYHRTNGGVSRFDKFRYYQQELLGLPLIRKEICELSRRFSALVVEKVIVAAEIPGVIAFIELCRRAGVDCALNSATPQAEIEEIVRRRGWDEYFCCILGSQSSKNENLKMILLTCGALPQEAIFFGDAQSDMSAAEGNSIDFVGIGPWMMERYGGDNRFAVYMDFADLLSTEDKEL